MAHNYQEKPILYYKFKENQNLDVDKDYQTGDNKIFDFNGEKNLKYLLNQNEIKSKDYINLYLCSLQQYITDNLIVNKGKKDKFLILVLENWIALLNNTLNFKIGSTSEQGVIYFLAFINMINTEIYTLSSKEGQSSQVRQNPIEWLELQIKLKALLIFMLLSLFYVIDQI